MPYKYYTRKEIIALPIPRNPQFKDLTGQRFGSSVVLAFAGRAGRIKLNSYWYSECDCGAITKRQSSSLKRNTKTCRACQMTKHGQCRTSEYGSWSAMKTRCHNPNIPCWHRYGGRGIKLCERWESFDNFLSDMGPKPSLDHSIERIDNNGNYEPSNCKWGTRVEQCNNQERNRLISHKGEIKTIAQWSGGSHRNKAQRCRDRLAVGWCFDCALNTPAYGRRCPHKRAER